MMLEEQLKEAAREPKQVTTDDKFACSPPICFTAVLPAKAYLKYVGLGSAYVVIDIFLLTKFSEMWINYLTLSGCCALLMKYHFRLFTMHIYTELLVA